MDFSRDFPATQQRISTSLVTSTRAAARVSAEDLAFHRSFDPAVASSVERQNHRLQALAEKLVARSASALDVGSVHLRDVDAIESNWSGVVDVIDGLLERADSCLDEFTGLVKRSTNPQPNTISRPIRNQSAFRTQNIPKPQLQFDHKPVNYPTASFKPLLTRKPHATLSLEESLALVSNDELQSTYQHPYQTEIHEYHFPSKVYTKTEPTPYTSFDTTQGTFIDDFDGVLEMLRELKKADEIAIDLEHHDVHSYIGIVSLMQISTRKHDWIVDTLQPWRQKLEVLNEVFTDPNILKVLHGSHMDIIWLQRDFGLYINGLFDTFDACRVLGYPAASLAFLLKKFVDFDAQKQYQMADWRIRPLPKEMFDYARSDTHFLLYIFDHLRNELIDKSNFRKPNQDLIQSVLKRSKETALQRYEHPIYDETNGLGRGGWLSLLQRAPGMLSKEQFAVFRKVHHWRDDVARQEDEGIHHILPGHVIFNVAQTMPSNSPELFSVLHSVSPSVRQRTDELIQVIRDAKINATEGPSMVDVLSAAPSKHHDRHKNAQTNDTPILPHNSSEAGINSQYRSTVSQFWGSVPTTSYVQTMEEHSGENGLDSFLFPLAEIKFDEAANEKLDHSFQGYETVTSQEQKTLPNPNKRKMNQYSDDISSSILQQQPTTQTKDSVMKDLANFNIEEEVRSRAERKAAKLEQKQRNKETEQNSMETAPFNYDEAPSVLHSREPRLGQNSTKSFNGFARAADTGAGLQRLQGGKSGKSSTFK